MSDVKSCLLVGVGGQGSLLASRILGNVLLAQGYDVKVSEVHGMSQRGGSVVTYIKFGEKVYSPVIEKGQADIIVSFEALEAARWVSFLKKGGKLVMNLGYSHPVKVAEIDGITIDVPGPNKIVISGPDKQKVGQFAAEVREKRPPEPYKGKGIKYVDEVIRRKVGKTGAKK